MRIVKDRALALLNGEIRDLARQCRRCESQIAKLSSWGLDAMSGKSVSALEANVRMRIAVVRAQLILFQSLRAADQKNARLVASLPTTSPGVLDTVRAEERIGRARSKEYALAQERDGILATCEPEMREDVRCRYRRLIDEQRGVVKNCQKILDRASRYSRDSLNVYRAVSVDAAQHALKSCDSFRTQGHWGKTGWAGLLFLSRDMSVRRAQDMSRAGSQSNAARLAAGDFEEHASLSSGRAELNRAGSVQVAQGELLGLTTVVAPYRDTRRSLDKEGYEMGLGVTGEAEFNVASGSVTETSGLVSGGVSASLFKETLSGAAGVSLCDEEGLNPSFVASVESSASVAEADAKMRIGSGDYNVSAGVAGKALTMDATAAISWGEDGAVVSVGAEGYVAQGTVSGGVTILGVNVGVSLKGSAGGAGGEAMARIGKTAFEGEVSFGLGVGVGAKVTLDWGGFGPAAENLRKDIASWWDSLTRREDDEDA